MSPAVIFAFLTLTPADPPPPPFAPPHVASVAMCSRDVADAFDRLDRALRHMGDEIDETKGKPERKEHMREDLAEAIARAQQAEIASCRPSRVTVVERAVVLDEGASRSLSSSLRREPFDDGRLSMLS